MSNNKGMSTALIAVLGVIVVLIVIVGIIFLWFMGTKNSLVAADESVSNKWGNVQTAYQRRADLVPNLVATVKASSDFEAKLLKDVTEARAGIANAKTPAELDKAGAQIQTAINVVVEAYPDIKSTTGYLDLQAQLEGTENRIKVERDNYNAAVKDYNLLVRQFPSSIVAGMSGFAVKDYFAAAAGSENAPNVGGLFNK